MESMRPHYHDLAPGDFSQEAMAPYAYVELKLDGLYAEFVGNSEGWSIHGRNGALLRYGEDACPDCFLRGEMIDGTEWARGSELCGSFVAWDCIYYHEHIPSSYIDQRAMLESVERQVPSACRMSISEGDVIDGRHESRSQVGGADMWDGLVMSGNWEGLVYRSADGQRYGRMKRIITQDYVCTGVKRQGPRVTAIYGGLWIDGILETVCTVPVKAATAQAMTGDFVGKVFEAKGNAVHKSGALRHPRQANSDGSVRWRGDKSGKECRL